MSSPVTFKVEGLRELDEALGELKKSTANAVAKRVLIQAAQPMVEMASRLAPDDPDTGAPDLHTSIVAGSKIKNEVGKAAFASVMEAGGSKAEAIGALRDARREANGAGSLAVVYVGPKITTKRNAIKAIVQEFGSVNQAPQSYMRPAFSATVQHVLSSVAGLMRTEIDKAAARARARALKKAAASGG